MLVLSASKARPCCYLAIQASDKFNRTQYYYGLRHGFALTDEIFRDIPIGYENSWQGPM